MNILNSLYHISILTFYYILQGINSNLSIGKRDVKDERINKEWSFYTCFVPFHFSGISLRTPIFFLVLYKHNPTSMRSNIQNLFLLLQNIFKTFFKMIICNPKFWHLLKWVKLRAQNFINIIVYPKCKWVKKDKRQNGVHITALSAQNVFGMLTFDLFIFLKELIPNYT